MKVTIEATLSEKEFNKYFPDKEKLVKKLWGPREPTKEEMEGMISFINFQLKREGKITFRNDEARVLGLVNFL